MKIMLIDKIDTLQQSLRKVLERYQERDVQLLWFRDGRNALDHLRKGSFDIVLMDLKIPGMRAHKFITKVNQLKPKPRIMIYTDIVNRDAAFAALKAGATSYMLKESTTEELANALKDLHGGGAPMSPPIAKFLVDELQSDSVASSLDILTDREKEVFQCIEQGKSYKGISLQLNITPNTVHSHLKSIYGKLHADGKEDALLKARRLIAA